jgi:hypothetical protein
LCLDAAITAEWWLILAVIIAARAPSLAVNVFYPVGVGILSPEYGNSSVAGAVIAGNLAHLSQ